MRTWPFTSLEYGEHNEHNVLGSYWIPKFSNSRMTMHFSGLIPTFSSLILKTETVFLVLQSSISCYHQSPFIWINQSLWLWFPVCLGDRGWWHYLRLWSMLSVTTKRKGKVWGKKTSRLWLWENTWRDKNSSMSIREVESR